MAFQEKGFMVSQKLHIKWTQDEVVKQIGMSKSSATDGVKRLFCRVQKWTTERFHLLN